MNGSTYEKEQTFEVIHSLSLFFIMLGCSINAWLAYFLFDVFIDKDKAAEIIVIALMWHLCAIFLDKSVCEENLGLLRKTIICITSVACYAILDKMVVTPFIGMLIQIVIPLVVALTLTRWLFKLRVTHRFIIKTKKLLNIE